MDNSNAVSSHKICNFFLSTYKNVKPKRNRKSRNSNRKKSNRKTRTRKLITNKLRKGTKRTRKQKKKTKKIALQELKVEKTNKTLANSYYSKGNILTYFSRHVCRLINQAKAKKVLE